MHKADEVKSSENNRLNDLLKKTGNRSNNGSVRSGSSQRSFARSFNSRTGPNIKITTFSDILTPSNKESFN